MLYQRYLTFIRSLRNSKKKCLVNLVNRCCSDNGYITKQNLNLISRECNSNNILNENPRRICLNISYSPVPPEEEWRIDFLKEMILLRQNELLLEGDSVTINEIEDIIEFICTS